MVSVMVLLLLRYKRRGDVEALAAGMIMRARNFLRFIHRKIHRYDPEKKRAWVQDYQVDASGMLRFTDVLRKINQEQDPGLAWISSCEHGQCGSCSAIVNGRAVLMCELLVGKAVERLREMGFNPPQMASEAYNRRRFLELSDEEMVRMREILLGVSSQYYKRLSSSGRAYVRKEEFRRWLHQVPRERLGRSLAILCVLNQSKAYLYWSRDWLRKEG